MEVRQAFHLSFGSLCYPVPSELHLPTKVPYRLIFLISSLHHT